PWLHRPAEAGADRVDENQIGFVEQGVIVVHCLVGRRERTAVLFKQRAARAEQSQMQPDGRGAGTAVERKGDRALREVPRAVFGVGDMENGRGGFVFIIAEQNRACVCGVIDFLPVNRDAVFGFDDLFLGFAGLRFVFIGFGGRLVGGFFGGFVVRFRGCFGGG